jgi:hypothetical protein
MAKGRTRTTSSSHAGTAPLTEAERRSRIAELAYLRALERGFQGGDPVDDWLAAEREVNRMLPKPRRQKQELDAYRKLRALVQELFAEVRGNMSAATVSDTLEGARKRLREAGGYTADAVDRAAATIEKEMADTVRRLGPTWQSVSGKTADLFDVWRDRSTGFLATAAAAAGQWLREAGARLERPAYRTGEMTAAGIFECIGCGMRVELETPAHLPPCPQCQKNEFRRV